MEASSCPGINQWIPFKVSGGVVDSSVHSPVAAQSTTAPVCSLTPSLSK